MRFGRVMLLACVISTAAVSMTGCAFVDKHVVLTYTPRNRKPAVPAEGLVVVGPFADLRENPALVSEVRNGYGMHTANVYAEDENAGHWVALALVAELRNQGYAVETSDLPADRHSNPHIGGSVPHVYAHLRVIPLLGGWYSARVKADVTLSLPSGTTWDTTVEGRASKGLWWGNTAEYEQVLERALRDMMKDLVPQLRDRLD